MKDDVDIKKFILLISFPAVVILVFLGLNLYTTTFGDEIVLKVAPVDTKDLFRGDYVDLVYEISTIDLNETPYDLEFSKGEAIYGTLSQKGEFWTLDSVSHDRPKTRVGQVFMKGRVTRSADYRVSVDWGIESYFLPEGAGRPIERQRDGNLSALVAVDSSGNPVLSRLMINGKTVEFD